MSPQEPQERSDHQHNVLLPASLYAELRRLHFEHQRRTGRRMTYAAFFRDVVLLAGLIELGERYPEGR